MKKILNFKDHKVHQQLVDKISQLERDQESVGFMIKEFEILDLQTQQYYDLLLEYGRYERRIKKYKSQLKKQVIIINETVLKGE